MSLILHIYIRKNMRQEGRREGGSIEREKEREGGKEGRGREGRREM